jgi:hypothetical protein
MIEEDEVVKMATNVDRVLQELMADYRIHPLSLSAVMLARLSHLNNVVGTTDEFIQLTKESIEQIRKFPLSKKTTH